MKPYKTFVEKTATKLKISQDEVLKMIACHHELEIIVPKKKQVNFTIDLTKKEEQYIKRVANVLKISVDAVICHLLVKEILKK